MKFDKIYCLHLAENKERYEHCVKEFEKIGIIDKVNFWWQTRSFLNEQAAELYRDYYEFFEAYRNASKKVLGAIYSCSRGHYEIIKTSYERGFENILIMEDDITFKDENSFKVLMDVMDRAPEDYECIKFCYYYGDYKDFNNFLGEWVKNKKEGDFVDLHCFPTPSTKCYALSRSGMKNLIEIYEETQQAEVADQTHWKMKVYGVDYEIVNRIIKDELFKSSIEI